MTAIVQYGLSHVEALELLTALSRNVPLKVCRLPILREPIVSHCPQPLIVNRHLQSIVRHPHFFKFCAVTAHNTSLLRDAIIDCLHVLFNLHPANTCQATHIEPLVRVYRGSISVSDRKLLSIFHLFEQVRKVSAASLLSRWSSSLNVTSSNALEAIQSLEPTLVLRTCLHLPYWRRLEDQTEAETLHDTQLHDPVFSILLFAQMLADGPPTTALSWVELFRTNIVSLIIRVMSSKDSRIREVATLQIAGLWKLLEVFIPSSLITVFPKHSHRPRTCKKSLTLSMFYAFSRTLCHVRRRRRDGCPPIQH